MSAGETCKPHGIESCPFCNVEKLRALLGVARELIHADRAAFGAILSNLKHDGVKADDNTMLIISSRIEAISKIDEEGKE